MHHCDQDSLTRRRKWSMAVAIRFILNMPYSLVSVTVLPGLDGYEAHSAALALVFFLYRSWWWRTVDVQTCSLMRQTSPLFTVRFLCPLHMMWQTPLLSPVQFVAYSFHRHALLCHAQRGSFLLLTGIQCEASSKWCLEQVIKRASSP
ncbi:hypothetical protein BJ546DRAFT_44274 [Cryomyces antarcticus]